MLGTPDVAMFVAIFANYLFLYPKDKKTGSWFLVFTGISMIAIELSTTSVPYFGFIVSTMGAILLVKYYLPEKF